MGGTKNYSHSKVARCYLTITDCFHSKFSEIDSDPEGRSSVYATKRVSAFAKTFSFKLNVMPLRSVRGQNRAGSRCQMLTHELVV